MLAEQFLPLDFSVFTAHEQTELEFSADEKRCLATGMSGVSCGVCFCLVLFAVINIYLGYVFSCSKSLFRNSLLGSF